MDIGVFLGITVAIFAVFGLCSLIKLTAEAFIMPEKYAVAVICDEDTDPEEIGLLVNRARTAWHRRGAGRTLVLVYGGIKIPEEVESALRDSNIPVYRVSAYPGTDDDNEE
jgi:hypothetical protein